VIGVTNIFTSAVSETGTVTDATFGVFGALGSSISESTSASDVIISRANFKGSISESLTATDSVSTISNFAANINENSTASDQAAATFLWNLINDTQNANWIDVVT
jgi:hypothetical protein